MTNGVPAIRLALEPSGWATAPERMSFSRLRQIESCPRRWSLMTGEYPQIWSKRGYPEPLIAATIVGRIMHRAFEIIVKELQKKDCESLNDPQTIAVMRELGGLSHVIEICTEEALAGYADNPRAYARIADMQRYLKERKGEIRENVSILLARVLTNRNMARRQSFGSLGNNGPLGCGVHTEVRLLNEEMKWEGIADVIRLSPDECEIRDIKTGVPKDDHAEQLRIYSLLWMLDTRKNPAGRPATKLTISYLHGDVDVAPLKIPEIAVFRQSLIARANTAREKLSIRPPEAKPSEVNRTGFAGDSII